MLTSIDPSMLSSSAYCSLRNEMERNEMKRNKMEICSQPRSQVLSSTRRETLVGFGHVSPRIWEITNKRLGGGAGKCEICLYKA